MVNRNLFSLSAVLLGALCLSACGDDDGGPKANKPVESPQVTQSASNLGSTSTQMVSISAERVSGQAAINQVGTSIYGFAGSHQSYKAQAVATQGLTAALAQSQVAEDENGTYSFENGRLQASFTYSGASGGGTSTNVVYEVDLTITEAGGGHTIAGDFSLDLEVAQPQFNLTYLIEATYDNLSLDAAGCPVGGGVNVVYDIELGGEQIDALPASARAGFEAAYKGGVVAATYGPNCGDVSVAGD